MEVFFLIIKEPAVKWWLFWGFVEPFHALGNKLVWSKVKQGKTYFKLFVYLPKKTGFGGRVKIIISGGLTLVLSSPFMKNSAI